ncbi:MAG: hypothetical protein ACJ763_11785 [Bdellovibrionia bacterium]
MMILRMSFFVSCFLLCASAYSQTEAQPAYQCSSGTSLKDGFLIYKTGTLQAAAKHKDGTISEISGIFGNFGPNEGFFEIMAIRPLTYAELNNMTVQMNQYMANQNQPFQGGLMNSGGMGAMTFGVGFPGTDPNGQANGMAGGQGIFGGGGMSGGNGAPQPASPQQYVMSEEAPDREDIESSPTRQLEPKAGDVAAAQARPGHRTALSLRAGDIAATQRKSGDRVLPRRGDQAPSMSEGARKFREPVQAKTGDLVMKRGAIAFSAQLDSQGNIRQISYRDGKRPTALWRAGARNPAGSESVYARLNGELSNIKSRAYCCTQNPGASCGDVLDRVGAQSSLRTEKPSIGQRMRSAWSDMINAFKSSSSSEAK